MTTPVSPGHAQASFTALGDLAGGKFVSVPHAISADGRTVVGSSETDRGKEAFVWRWSAGEMIGLGTLAVGMYADSEALDVSDDGSRIVGWTDSPLGREGFLYENGVMTGLGDLPGRSYSGEATGISSDGSTVVGHGNSSARGREPMLYDVASQTLTPLIDLSGGRPYKASAVSGDGRWIAGSVDAEPANPSVVFQAFVYDRADDRYIVLDNLPDYTYLTHLSDDGSTAVGHRRPDGTNSGNAFAYDIASGVYTELGDLPGGNFTSLAYDVSADGRFVVGMSEGSSVGSRPHNDGAFLWERGVGMRSVENVLFDLGLTADDFYGWNLQQATAISADGNVIAGVGSRFFEGRYRTEAWVAVLDESRLLLLGDYNGNGSVDAADYTVWRDLFGSSTELAADGNGNGLIDAADYTIWRDQFGSISGIARSDVESRHALVPEPSAGVAMLTFLKMAFRRRTGVARTVMRRR